ncbi:MAG TPA: histidine kinase N-terminal 7TM domain-containing protein [Anaerolineae bacterium]|nr:histidine kinase N-terminal 7TM domain-containing protein [Anaerolineae bacterium]
MTGSNQVISSAITILAFSLLVYMLIHNLRSSVGRSFAALLACMCFAYAGDVALFRVDNLAAAIPWLKFQWIGIAFLPAAYLHFADALLRTTNAPSLRRRFAVWIAYFFGLLVFLLALQTEFLVHNPFYSPGVTQFRAGPFFWVFTTYFYTTLFWGAYKIYSARARCLTSGARRRMTYLAISFAAPALGVYPYMLIASSPSFSPMVIFFILLLVNIGIAVMIMVMAYSVAFFGAIPPDRAVKHDLVHFLLRGPLVAIVVIFIVQALPEQERILGLPRDFIFATSIVGVIVISQFLINLAKPAIDSLISYRDRIEIAWISELDRRLLTTTDLQQALENVLTTLCETLRVRHGFIYNLVARQGPRLETRVGSAEVVDQALAAIDVPALIEQKNGGNGYHFIIQNGFWFVILQNKARDRYLGLLGLEARSSTYDLTATEEDNAAFLIEQAELALEDRRLQQEVFMALKNIIPEIDRIQRLRSAVRYTGSPSLVSLTESPILEKEFPQMVRDALSHYWGGPKLTGSPLLGLRVVQDALTENDGNAVRALRAVLTQAIEKQRPDGERRMTATEWLIYNILDLKFVQGMRVRDIAQRLAMSEADLYRKQKLAIDEVIRTLSEMEAKNTPPLAEPVRSEKN